MSIDTIAPRVCPVCREPVPTDKPQVVIQSGLGMGLSLHVACADAKTEVFAVSPPCSSPCIFPTLYEAEAEANLLMRDDPDLVGAVAIEPRGLMTWGAYYSMVEHTGY